MPVSRRFPPEVPPEIGRGNLTDPRVGGRLYRFLRWCSDNAFGIPGGFKGTKSPPVIVGTAAQATPGTEDASWKAADSQDVILAAAPVALGSINVEGTSSRVSRADHIHERNIYVTVGGVPVTGGNPNGVYNVLDFSPPEEWLVTPDGGGFPFVVHVKGAGGDAEKLAFLGL